MSVRDMAKVEEERWREQQLIPRVQFWVQMPLGGNPVEWYTLCRCCTAEAAGNIIIALMGCGDPPEIVRILRVTI